MNQPDEIERQASQASGDFSLKSPAFPTFSVVMAAYNAAGYIERAVRSVQDQSLTSWELLISDDGSKDATKAVVERLQASDPRIQYLPSETNMGPGGARNRGIDAARGEWIAVLDADDAWRPDRLEKLLKVARDQGCDVVADNYIRFDDTTQIELGPVFPASSASSPLTVERYLYSERPLGNVRLGLLKPLISRAFLNAKGLRYSTEIRYAEDFLFFVTLLIEGAHSYLLNDPLYIYTLPRSPVTGKASGGTRTTPKLTDRVWLADLLISRYGDRPDPAVRQALDQYRRGMATIVEGQQAHLLWQNGRKGAALTRLISNPWAFFAYAWNQPNVKRVRLKFFPAGVP